jgi:cell division septal protein FtsQ
VAKKLKKKVVRAAKSGSTLKERIPVVILRSSIGLFCVVIIGLAVFTYRLLYRSDYFYINGSDIEWLESAYAGKKDYSGFRATGAGENILNFDASSAGDYLLAENPELRSIQIIKNFPDRLLLKVAPRVPIAQVGDWSFNLIDNEGVILTQARSAIAEGLPIITGAGWRRGRKVGHQDSSLRMQRGLALLKAARDTGFLDEHILTKVDISDHRNLAFFIEDGLEIKIGHSDFSGRLDELEKTLDTMVVDKDQIRYIDLRFEDVVLGTK